MQRLIITGANGVGKSHFAARLGALRPDIPIISFDAIKLRTNWRQKPRDEIEAALADALDQGAWILEGGPSLLAQALEKADGLVWLDPPERIRAWQLALRPCPFIGRTRPELPAGNVDWPWQQYRFALRSLRNGAQFRSYLSEVFEGTTHIPTWRCRNDGDLVAVEAAWAGPAR